MRFFTTKAEGSGIGIVLPRQIAEAHRGKLSRQTAETHDGTLENPSELSGKPQEPFRTSGLRGALEIAPMSIESLHESAG